MIQKKHYKKVFVKENYKDYNYLFNTYNYLQNHMKKCKL